MLDDRSYNIIIPLKIVSSRLCLWQKPSEIEDELKRRTLSSSKYDTHMRYHCMMHD
jgi:hypothetical protein